VQVTGPKGPVRYGGADLETWARHQVQLASEIIDNPGGGLLFATQTIGQVRAALADAGPGRWQPVIELLEEAEDLGVRRRFAEARALLAQALQKLSAQESTQPAESDP
jgi:hypothetical protein